MICFSYKKQKGAVMIICLIFLCVFSALAISMSSFSDSNVQVADNQLKANRALESAHSGLEVMRFWLGHVYMPGTTTPEDRFSVLANFIQDDLQTNGIYNIPVTVDTNCIELGSQINPVTLETAPNRSFAATIQPTENVDVLQMDITGSALSLEKTIRVNYNFGTRAHTVFDYGVATKGPLQLQGNIEMDGANVELDAGVYIESDDANALSIIGNSSIAGDVSITNPDAIVDLQGGQASIGGETGQDAIDNHVTTGVPPTEFPVPIPGYFEHYVQNTYDPNNVLAEYENVRIPAGTNPQFGAVTIRGVVFIETPNVVTFTGNTEITGVIVGNGDLGDNSGTNQIIFLGDVASYPVSDLPEGEPQFDQLRNETGTFLMAPGFSAVFGGSFETLNGAIAANGIEFFGNAGGTIDGSILNYSGNPMTLSGNSDLFFNRSGTDEMPAGFGPELILYYVADSYSEVVL
ncbi:MAG: hypothetical protein ACYS9Y_01745 [Planctomycetota bacterium]|jgi:hypothetical protein